MSTTPIHDTTRHAPLPATHDYHETITLLCRELAGLYYPQAAEELVQSALEREAMDTTYIGRGLAIPHARVEGLSSAAIYTAHAPAGIDWNGNSATTIVLLAVPAEQPELYLQMMSSVVRRYKG